VSVAAAVHVCRAAQGFKIYEANRLLNPLRDRMPIAPLRLDDGAFIAEDRPGHGGDPRDDVLEDFRLTIAVAGPR
jgi:L-alanine-DL-glutamate epimerase-like enolase superfamily enzyme